jgi:hypothetical protein
MSNQKLAIAGKRPANQKSVGLAEVFKEKPRLISAQQANGLRHEEKRKTRRLSEVMRRAWTPDMADYRRRLSLVHPASTLC